MNKKKLITMLTALSLVAVIGVGATLAYFTDSDEATNVITMGHVDIDLDEPNFDPTPDDEEKDNKIENIVPGQKITKDPTITVAEDSEDAYVRAKVTIESDKLSNDQKDELLANINIDLKTDVNPNGKWILSGDYYYYVDKVTAGDKITLFDTVTIPATWGNATADATINITVSAEAIQADNFTPSEVNDVYGWYNGTEAITAETYTAPVPEATEAE